MIQINAFKDQIKYQNLKKKTSRTKEKQLHIIYLNKFTFDLNVNTKKSNFKISFIFLPTKYVKVTL